MNNEAKSAKSVLNFRIEGGHKLHGEITVRTSKNGAVGLLCASLLNKDATTIKNAPKIEEVYRIIEVLQSIGVSVEWKESDIVITPPEKLNLETIDYEAAAKTRSCIMLIGSLVHLLKKFDLPQAGGCKLGTRTVKPYFYALEKLGVKIEAKSKYYEVSHSGFPSHDTEIILYEAGDTVTETVLMVASKLSGKTTIKFASANYQVQDICFYLQLLGVKIEGIGTSTLVVQGVSEMNRPVEYFLSEDPIEAMSLIATAIVTDSAITIKRCPVDFLELELLKLEKMGFSYKITNRYKALNGLTNLVDIETKSSKLKALEEKIHAMPYPGLNIDNLPFFVVIGAVAEGQTLIHDWAYEDRMIYLKDLDKLGAETILGDPHRFYIKGPTQFKATEIDCPPALRPSVVILIAMLAAKGTSVLRNVYNINRGYEDLASRLNKLGAKIETFES
ncbi:MAG: UDP-N-acetylglucosamine 1-carboxyvinyltransferase [Candidatus Paceibacterota bacterium]